MILCIFGNNYNSYMNYNIFMWNDCKVKYVILNNMMKIMELDMIYLIQYHKWNIHSKFLMYEFGYASKKSNNQIEIWIKKQKIKIIFQEKHQQKKKKN